MLESLGLTVDIQPMGMGTPYANVLLAARNTRHAFEPPKPKPLESTISNR